MALAVSMTLVYECAYVRQAQRDPSPPPPPKKSELLQYNSKFFTLPGAGRFLKVADQIRSVGLLLSTNNRLLLYSLYKQATRGDAPLTYESRSMHLGVRPRALAGEPSAVTGTERSSDELSVARHQLTGEVGFRRTSRTRKMW
jgi:hypothetical protein